MSKKSCNFARSLCKTSNCSHKIAPNMALKIYQNEHTNPVKSKHMKKLVFLLLLLGLSSVHLKTQGATTQQQDIAANERVSYGAGDAINWHPYHCPDEVRNEDLWELFMEDYNKWYTSHSTTPINEKHIQPITGAMGFMFPGDTASDGTKKYPNGLVKDFVTNEKSYWKWLGDYIYQVAKDGVLPTNEALWKEFKPYYNTYYGLNRSDQPITNVAGFANVYMKDIMTNNASEYKWLGDYIYKVTTDAGRSLNTEVLWRFAVQAFFNCSSAVASSFNGNADFTTAGKPENWTKAPGYIKPDYSFDTNKEVEWRKHVHTFFNKTNSVTYTVVGNTGSKTETTVDFSTKGQSKPNNDPAEGWYNAWWNATFPTTMLHGQELPRLKRAGYLFSGWYYGDANGYILKDAPHVGKNKEEYLTYDASEGKKHLWARWLELCLYEDYIEPEEHALDENGEKLLGKTKVNNNKELAQCADGKSHYIDIVRPLIGGEYNTMFLPFGINGLGTVKKDANGNPISGICGKRYYLNQVVDDNGKKLLDPDQTEILVYDTMVTKTVGQEKVLEFQFHNYAEEDSLETIASSTPFLIKPKQDVNVRMHFWSALLFSFTTAGQPTNFRGVPEPRYMNNPEGFTNFMLVNECRLAEIEENTEMYGLRAYFKIPNTVPAGIHSVIKVNTTATDVDNISTQASTTQKIIRNGHLYILRGGNIYNITGLKIK